MTDDILQPISEDRIQSYLDVYKKHLPKTVDPYNFLLRHVKWNRIFSSKNLDTSSLCVFNLFIPQDGDANHCTMFAITEDDPLQKVR